MNSAYEFEARDNELGREMEVRERRESEDPIWLRGPQSEALDDPPIALVMPCALYENPDQLCLFEDEAEERRAA